MYTKSTVSWLNFTCYNHPSSNSSSIKSNITEFSSEDGRTAQVWNIRWFAILSASLLFVTIILPLVIGPVQRNICHFYIKLRQNSRAVLSNLVLCLLIYSYVGISPYSRIMASLCDGCLLGLVIRRTWLSGRPSRYTYLWTFWTFFVISLFVLDVIDLFFKIGLIG